MCGFLNVNMQLLYLSDIPVHFLQANKGSILFDAVIKSILYSGLRVQSNVWFINNFIFQFQTL